MKTNGCCIALAFLSASFGCYRDAAVRLPPPSAADTQVVFRSADGRELTTADLAEAEGKVEFNIMCGRAVPDEANNLHQEGRHLGAAGKYDDAISCFIKAQSLAPDWPYPTYDMAFAYLLKEDFAQSRRCYEKVIELSPRGFFTAITALDTLRREASGDLPQGTYAAYVGLEWISDPAKKAEVVTAMTERLPSFAPAWKEYALQCDDPAAKLTAIEKGLAANPDAETKGMLLINKALTLNTQGNKEAAKDILGNLALDASTTFANEHLAKQMLAMITR
jgi:tetratricopeptide (TPR) repeat protein